jgi:hypothetical protein
VSRPPDRSSLSLVTAALIGIAQMYLVNSLWAYSFLQPFAARLTIVGGVRERLLFHYGLLGLSAAAAGLIWPALALPQPAPPSQPLEGP